MHGTFTKERRLNPKVYGLGERDYLQLLEDESIDACVIIATSGAGIRDTIATMNTSQHVGVEVWRFPSTSAGSW